MTLTELKYIIAVAQEKNFNRAAEKCFVSQPTLSIAIKKLEEQLNITIFERGKNYISITKVGKKIIAQAQTVLEEAAKIKMLANEGQNQLTEILRIGAILTVGPYVFPKLIPAINRLAPDMPLIIEENFTAKLCEKLHNGALDAAIVAMPFDELGIKTLPIYRESFEVVLPKNHSLKNKVAIEPNDFSCETVLLLGEGNCFRDQVLAACPACAVPSEAQGHYEKMLEGSSLETIRYMVANGIGISVMPALANQRHAHGDDPIIVKPFADHIPYREIAIAVRESFPRPDAIAILREAFYNINFNNITLIKD
jgi:LysR family hydrogen peroxide-inducible transcriptional activator